MPQEWQLTLYLMMRVNTRGARVIPQLLHYLIPLYLTRPHQFPAPTEGAAVLPTDILIPPPVPASDSGISKGALRGAIQMLTQIVASQAQRLNVTPTFSIQQGGSIGYRMNMFFQLDPPMFTCANPEEDPHDFIDKMHKTLRVMRATKTEGVELAAYLLKGVAYSRFGLWEDSRDEGSLLARWSEFADALMDHFFPFETRAARATEFENLKQGSKSVWEYHMEFVRLSKDAIFMLPTMEGLSPLVINDAATTALNSDMNYRKMIAFAQATENRKLKNRMCRLRGHIQRECRSSRQGTGRGTAQPSSSAAATSSTPPPARGTPARTRRGAARGGAQSSGGPSHFYTMSGLQSAEDSPYVVTGILIVQFHDVTDTDAEAPTLESVPLVNELPEVFPDELPRIPPDKEIDFVIDVMTAMRPISIPPYRMAPAELMELKE
ncbi:uncharacterized protein [Nicotiana tomentosiformis]|uniref:uncharacterized protein n=1 Tax=Nicotiana tomentosiformis TaxID=4098 RepID=UPI00388CBC0E